MNCFLFHQKMSSFLYLYTSICSFCPKKNQCFCSVLMAVVRIQVLWLISDKPIKWNNDNAMFVIVKKIIFHFIEQEREREKHYYVLLICIGNLFFSRNPYRRILIWQIPTEADDSSACCVFHIDLIMKSNTNI